MSEHPEFEPEVVHIPSFQYDPEPEKPEWLRTPGVMDGYLVMSRGVGPAKIAECTALIGEDGEWTLTNREGGSGLEMRDVTIVDDTESE